MDHLRQSIPRPRLTTTLSMLLDLAILDAYADDGVTSHWYVATSVAQERILQAAEVLDVHDLVRVWDWPPATVRRD